MILLNKFVAPSIYIILNNIWDNNDNNDNNSFLNLDFLQIWDNTAGSPRSTVPKTINPFLEGFFKNCVHFKTKPCDSHYTYIGFHGHSKTFNIFAFVKRWEKALHFINSTNIGTHPKN